MRPQFRVYQVSKHRDVRPETERHEEDPTGSQGVKKKMPQKNGAAPSNWSNSLGGIPEYTLRFDPAKEAKKGLKDVFFDTILAVRPVKLDFFDHPLYVPA